MSNRSEKLSGLAQGTETIIPSINQIVAEGRMDLARHEERTKECTLMWCRMAERIRFIRDIHGLRGEAMLRKARQIGLTDATTRRLVNLYPHSEKVLAICAAREKSYRSFEWPGLATMLALVGIEDDGESYVNMHYAGGNDERPTPQYLINWIIHDMLHIEGFDLDVAATRESSKADRCFTADEDALTQEWIADWAFMNPPYSLRHKFMRKMFEEVRAGRCRNAAALMIGRLDEPWWHEVCIHARVNHIFRGRIQFLEHLPTGSAPFFNIVSVFDASLPLNTTNRPIVENVKPPKRPSPTGRKE